MNLLHCTPKDARQTRNVPGSTFRALTSILIAGVSDEISALKFIN